MNSSPIITINKLLKDLHINNSNIDVGSSITNLQSHIYSSNEHSNSIIINGTGQEYNSDASNAFFVKPVRNINTTNLLHYNESSGEISFGKIKDMRNLILGSHLVSFQDTDNQRFGYMVAINNTGDKIAISAPWINTPSGQGAIWFYKFINNNWEKVNIQFSNGYTNFRAELGIPGETNSNYGFCMEMSDDGSRVIISASYNDSTIYSNGLVDVYSFDSDFVRLIHRFNQAHIENELGTEDTTNFIRFGQSVASNSDGTIVAIGADGYNNYTGRAYVYLFNSDRSDYGLLLEGLKGEYQDDHFGCSISISDYDTNTEYDNMRVAIGANKYNQGNGKFYIYQYILGAWELIVSQDGTMNENLGSSIVITRDGTRVAVGAPLHGSNIGKVYIYDIITNNNNGEFSYNINLKQSISGATVYDYLGGGAYYILDSTSDINHIDATKLLSFSNDKTKFVIGNGAASNGQGKVLIYKYDITTDLYFLHNSINGIDNGRFGNSAIISGDGHRIIVGEIFSEANEKGNAKVYKIYQDNLETGDLYINDESNILKYNI